MNFEHDNILLIDNWLKRENLVPKLEDEFIRTVYHEVLEKQFKISKIESIKKRTRAYKLQYDFVRRDLLKIIYRNNDYNATGISAGYVYAIGNPAWNDYIKIGCAIDVNDRLKSYQTSSPLRDYFLIDYYFVYNRRLEEENLHSRFPDRENEWVKIQIEDIRKMFKIRKEERIISPTSDRLESRIKFYYENNRKIHIH